MLRRGGTSGRAPPPSSAQPKATIGNIIQERFEAIKTSLRGTPEPVPGTDGTAIVDTLDGIHTEIDEKIYHLEAQKAAITTETRRKAAMIPPVSLARERRQFNIIQHKIKTLESRRVTVQRNTDMVETHDMDQGITKALGTVNAYMKTSPGQMDEDAFDDLLDDQSDAFAMEGARDDRFTEATGELDDAIDVGDDPEFAAILRDADAEREEGLDIMEALSGVSTPSYVPSHRHAPTPSASHPIPIPTPTPTRTAVPVAEWDTGW